MTTIRAGYRPFEGRDSRFLTHGPIELHLGGSSHPLYQQNIRIEVLTIDEELARLGCIRVIRRRARFGWLVHRKALKGIECRMRELRAVRDALLRTQDLRVLRLLAIA